jgi:hypothetical protein
MGVKRPRDFILTLEDDEVASQSESESDDTESVHTKKKKTTDEDLNPDFEFDGYGVLSGVKGIDDDGWGFKGIVGMKEGAGVDLDGIIARRRENLDDDDDDESNDIAGEEVGEESDEDEEFKGFDDDDIGT